MAQPLGFVVLDEDHYPLVLKRDRVLWIGHRLWTITAFATRDQAQSAVDRTRRYAAHHGYNWGETYYIVRLLPFLRTPRKQAVAKDGRFRLRPQQTKARNAGKKKPTRRSTRKGGTA